MTREETIAILTEYRKKLINSVSNQLDKDIEAFDIAIKDAQNIKALGEDMRMLREGIIDEKVLIGFNMAVALCNKYLAEGSDKEWNELQTIKTQEPCSEVIAKMNNLRDFFDVQSKAITNFISRPIECGCQQGAELVPHYKDIKHTESKGHWILDETDNSITCDKCGCLIWANDISNGDAHYCPNCGARMKNKDVI